MDLELISLCLADDDKEMIFIIMQVEVVDTY